ncbi:MAG: division/cell wall cluster transcriptional repressor MraZ [Gammaproteobacteria bacterium]|nr:division/cell wall cluster transcriptional repressor MraZ [Gammaproteobacteria bacterium]NIR82272.1 division/cell wall cluster transcriptional repressor MraZ [Gammaproteobacteria bacterium]NIR91203.1 division/cell wall cluster transcriptional repressor MraZ [Gammaproteobacteria bacterium]NIU03421.1 division/cell wall cluster transcriptional repressor MraZ [Gammaproteobacteria bacterium]NIX84696.1 division/cell wall cluster transcriptional repressor MraZ [Gammaproteobacteria bacterium]
MFRGEHSLSLDDKGRLAVPSRYRDRLLETCAGKLVVTIGLLERCLAAYPFASWQQIEDDLRSLPALDRKAQAISHLLIGHATECDMDNHGRILIPQSLRDFAGLDRRVKLIGQVNKFELWDESAWTARREELLGQVSDLLAQPSEALRSLVF